MDAVIDIGNSKAKIALYDQNKIVEHLCFDNLTAEIIEQILKKYAEINQAILCTTRLHDTSLENFLRKKLTKFIVFDPSTTPTPLRNMYRTPQTLGADRLAAAVAAWRSFTGENIVIFDFGTAMTVDYVSAKGEFVGGNIAPGLSMRFKALNDYTDRLPLCSADHYHDQIAWGNDTKSAILKGVVNGMRYEIEGYIAENQNSKIFFTGGDALFFEKQIKNTIFADHDAVFRGLHIILNESEI